MQNIEVGWELYSIFDFQIHIASVQIYYSEDNGFFSSVLNLLIDSTSRVESSRLIQTRMVDGIKESLVTARLQNGIMMSFPLRRG